MKDSILKVVHLTPAFAEAHPYNHQLVSGLRDLGVFVKTVSDRNFVVEVLRFKPDVLHFHWLHSFVESDEDGASLMRCTARMLGLLTQLLICKASGIKLVWTVHELHIPESHHPNLDILCNRLIVSISDAVITHCKNARALVSDKYSSDCPERIKVVPHGSFIDVTENDIQRSDARRILELPESAFVILFFGLIRPYKGVLDLVKAHKRLGREDAILYVAGGSVMHHQKCVDYVDEIKREIDGLPNIRFELGFVPEDRIQLLMNASDAVAFPYRDIMTSGALIMAMGFEKACIAARIGCIGELLDEEGAFLYEPGDIDGLVTALSTAIASAEELPAMGAHNRKLAEGLSWLPVATRTLEVYGEIIPPEKKDRLERQKS